MKTNLNAEPQTAPGKFLAGVVGNSQHIHALIEQSAEELSSANTTVKHELASGDPPPGVKMALGKLEAVLEKLQDACEELAAVNQALQVELRDRIMVDHQMAAAVEQEEGSRHTALHDHLTGLPNRELFKDRLDHGIAHANRHGGILAVMFVDLDNFKSINDMYGHEAGDAALQAVAIRLANSTRSDDTVSRHGGDEFLCLLTPLHEHKDASIIAAKILAAIRAPCEVRVGGGIINLCLDASIGISIFPEDGASAASLIAGADDAMYQAKENRAGVAFAQETAASFARAVAYGLADPRVVASRHGASRICNVESSANNRSLSGASRQTVRA